VTYEIDDLSKHIFQHYNFTYVVDFTNKQCFIIDHEDDVDPIVMFNIKRNPTGWVYKSSGLTEDAPFIDNTDDEWSEHMDNKYLEYIRTLIVNQTEITE